MYSGLSQDFIRVMKLPAQKYCIHGSFDGISVGPKNIVQNSVRISNSCSDNSNISIGNVHIGQLNIIFTGLIVSGSCRNKEIVLYEDLLIDEDNDLWESVLLGHFIVDESQYSSLGVEIVAYDNMAKFDKEIPDNFRTSGTLYNFISDCCSACGVTFGMTQAQIEAMPNGTETLSLYSESDIEYYRDLISWCAQTMGANALITRGGELKFKCYCSTSSLDETFNQKDRLEGGKCSDFTSFYTSISMVNTKGNTVSYYELNPNNGSMMELGNNPLLQPESEDSTSSVDSLRVRILNAISSINYTPFVVNIYRPFIYDLMDVIKLVNIMQGLDVISCITSYNWSFMNGYTIQCVGSNPALATKKAKKHHFAHFLILKPSFIISFSVPIEVLRSNSFSSSGRFS